MIVTGKPYQLQFKPRKDATSDTDAQPARKPVKSEKLAAEEPVVLEPVATEENSAA